MTAQNTAPTAEQAAREVAEAAAAEQAQKDSTPKVRKAPTAAEAMAKAQEALAEQVKLGDKLDKLAAYVDEQDKADAAGHTDAKAPNIIQALAAVKLEVGHVGKESQADAKLGGYKFRGVDAVVNACAGPLARHGVVVVPDVLNVERTITTTNNGAPMLNVYATVRFTFHGPAGDSIAATVVGEAADRGDKAHSKAQSVAYRVALLQTLTLPTDEPDPDSEGYERGNAQPNRQTQAPQTDPGVVQVQRRFRALSGEALEYLRSVWNQHMATADIPNGGPWETQPHQVEAVMAILAEAEQAAAPAALAEEPTLDGMEAQAAIPPQ